MKGAQALDNWSLGCLFTVAAPSLWPWFTLKVSSWPRAWPVCIVSWGVSLCSPNIEQRQTGETIHSFQAQLGEPVSLLGLLRGAWVKGSLAGTWVTAHKSCTTRVPCTTCSRSVTRGSPFSQQLSIDYITLKLLGGSPESWECPDLCEPCFFQEVIQARAAAAIQTDNLSSLCLHSFSPQNSPQPVALNTTCQLVCVSAPVVLTWSLF